MQAYSASFKPALDICMEIYEDVASGNEIRSVVQVRGLLPLLVPPSLLLPLLLPAGTGAGAVFLLATVAGANVRHRSCDLLNVHGAGPAPRPPDHPASVSPVPS